MSDNEYEKQTSGILSDNEEAASLIFSVLIGELNRGEISYRISDLKKKTLLMTTKLGFYEDGSLRRFLVAFLTGNLGRNNIVALEILEHVKLAINKDIPNSIELSAALQELLKSSEGSIKRTQLNIDLLLTNNGRSTITFDGYLVAKLEYLESTPFFFESKSESSFTTISSGQSVKVTYNQLGILEPEHRITLEALFGNRSFELFAMSKVVSGSIRSSNWIESPNTQVGGNLDFKREKYYERVQDRGF